MPVSESVVSKNIVVNRLFNSISKLLAGSEEHGSRRIFFVWHVFKCFSFFFFNLTYFLLLLASFGQKL